MFEMDEDNRRKCFEYWRRDQMHRDWDDLPMTSINAQDPTQGNNMLRFALARRSGTVIGDTEQPRNPVVGNVVQQQKPLEVRDMAPASPALTEAARNPSDSKKKKNNKDDVHRLKKVSSSAKKRRVVWENPLHQKFLATIDLLGGDAGKAVPKKILELMNVPELTRENVASHLQKYRLSLKKKKAEKSNEATVAGSMSLPNQPPYDLYGYPGHQNWDFQPQYYPQRMNWNECRQSVPPYRNMNIGAQMAPPYESSMQRRNNEQLPILDGMARTFPMGRNGPIDIGRQELYSSNLHTPSPWSDIPFRCYPDSTCTLASHHQDYLPEGLPYGNEFSHMGTDDLELQGLHGLLNVLNPSQPPEFIPHQSQDRMVFHQPANAVPCQSHGSMIPNQGATFDMQGTVPLVAYKPDSISPPSTASFGSVPPDQQGGTGINENEHGVTGLAQANTPSSELFSGTALALPDQQGAPNTGLCEDTFGFNGLGQANDPTGPGRGFGLSTLAGTR